MALDLQAYRAKQIRSLKADLGDGDVLNFKYDASRYTEDFMKAVQKLAGVETEGEIVVSLSVANFVIRELVTEWEFVDGGIPVPLTEPVIASLPILITGPIAQAIFTDQSPGND